MMKQGIDQDALIKMISESSAKQGTALRTAVSDATLKALQGREFTLDNMRKVVKSVAQATAAGASQSPLGHVDMAGMLGQAFAGIDSALLQVVDANRTALQQFVDQGAALKEGQMKTAIANVEKMEDTFFDAMRKAVPAGGPMQAPWDQALAAMKVNGTETGQEAVRTVSDLTLRAQTALRESRASGMRATQAMLDGYAAMVGGVLLGMSEAIRSTRAAAPAPEPAAKATPRKAANAAGSGRKR